jgi:hypothetical protein
MFLIKTKKAESDIRSAFHLYSLIINLALAAGGGLPAC